MGSIKELVCNKAEDLAQELFNKDSGELTDVESAIVWAKATAWADNYLAGQADFIYDQEKERRAGL